MAKDMFLFIYYEQTVVQVLKTDRILLLVLPTDNFGFYDNYFHDKNKEH